MQSNRARMQVVGNSSLGAPFALGENFGEQQTKSLVATPKFPPNTKLPPQILEFDLKTDSANPQNLNKNNPRVSANLKSRPLRGAKNQNQASSSGKADFLLEAEKRGTPPKSEKRSFWRVGGAGRGVQPFCEKESSEIDENSVQVAESSLDSADSQNLIKTIAHAVRTLTKFLLLFAFAKRRVPLHPVIARKSVGFSWQSTK